MYFGDIPIAQAQGAILAHSRRVGDKRFKKGRILSADDIDALSAIGVEKIIGAVLDADDVAEDEAASLLASAIGADGVSAGAPFTGRCNLFSDDHGILVVDQLVIDEINLVDESITVATLAPWSVVDSRQMIATIKIIPFAVAKDALNRCLEIATEAASSPESNSGGCVSAAKIKASRVALIQTELPDTNSKVLEKTSRVMATRLQSISATITHDTRCAHDVEALCAALQADDAKSADMILVAGASAIVDRRDVIPAGISQAGGQIDHFGMPVDPGNLLLLGTLNNRPVLGLPGCARSPKYNGLDAVLERLVAGITVTGNDVMKMGVGGLLKEFVGRPAPRSGTVMAPAKAPIVGAIVLAGGQSRRMGEQNKLLADVDGKTMVQQTVQAVKNSDVSDVTIVTGFESDKISSALSDMEVNFVHNDNFDSGLSTSLRAGLGALPEDFDAVLVCLGDMPRVSSSEINKLIAAFDPVEGREICIPLWQGKRGNPVLWSRRFVDEMQSVAGDTGARHMIGEHEEFVCEVPVETDSTLVDVDTPEALAALRESLKTR